MQCSNYCRSVNAQRIVTQLPKYQLVNAAARAVTAQQRIAAFRISNMAAWKSADSQTWEASTEGRASTLRLQQDGCLSGEQLAAFHRDGAPLPYLCCRKL